MLCVFTPLASAQVLPASVLACVQETDSARRLACYDREVLRLAPAAAKRMPAEPPSSASLESAAPNTPPAADISPVLSDSPEHQFGMTGQLQRKEGTQPPQVDKLSVRIAALSYKPRGEAIVTLENSQVWEEADAESHLPLHVGDTVTIRRGVLGAFYMSSDKVLGLRVKRVR